MLKLVLSFYVLVLAFGAFSAVFRFLLDVRKWHDKETKEEIHESIRDVIEDIEKHCESEVNTSEIPVIDITTEIHA